MYYKQHINTCIYIYVYAIIRYMTYKTLVNHSKTYFLFRKNISLINLYHCLYYLMLLYIPVYVVPVCMILVGLGRGVWRIHLRILVIAGGVAGTGGDGDAVRTMGLVSTLAWRLKCSDGR